MIKRLALGLWVILLCATSLQAAEPLMKTVYITKYLGFDLKLERTLRSIGDNRFVFESHAKSPMAVIEETSTFSRDASGRWFALHYSNTREVLGISRKYELLFDDAKGTATYRDKKGQTQIQTPPGTLDPLLYQLRLQYDLAQQAGEYRYQFVSRKKLKDYQFQVTGRENLTLNGRSIETVLLSKQDNKTSQTTRIWFSPDNGYQLARLRHTDNEDTYTITLDQLQLSPQFDAWLKP